MSACLIITKAQITDLQLAAELKPELADVDGFIAIERFQSLTDQGKICLSRMIKATLIFWSKTATARAVPEAAGFRVQNVYQPLIRKLKQERKWICRAVRGASYAAAVLTGVNDGCTWAVTQARRCLPALSTKVGLSGRRVIGKSKLQPAAPLKQLFGIVTD